MRGVPDRLFKGGQKAAVGAGSLRDVDDVDTLRHGLVDGLGEAFGGAGLLFRGLLERDDGRLGRDSEEARALDLAGGDDSGDLGAVADLVLGRLALDETLAAAADRALELLVARVDTGVDDADANSLTLHPAVRPQLIGQEALERPRGLFDVVRAELALTAVERHVLVRDRRRGGDAGEAGNARRRNQSARRSAAVPGSMTNGARSHGLSALPV